MSGKMPNIDWPPNVPRPTNAEILLAAEQITGHTPAGGSQTLKTLYRAAAFPWLLTPGRMSRAEASEILGANTGLRLSPGSAAHEVMISRAGQAIAHAMSKRLREIVRERMEQTQ